MEHAQGRAEGATDGIDALVAFVDAVEDPLGDAVGVEQLYGFVECGFVSEPLSGGHERLRVRHGYRSVGADLWVRDRGGWLRSG